MAGGPPGCNTPQGVPAAALEDYTHYFCCFRSINTDIGTLRRKFARFMCA